MLDWDDLRFFGELAKRGSLSETARQLGTDHSTVSRRISGLESATGLKLFHRMPRGYGLTPEGALLLERMQPLEDAVHSIERLAGSFGNAIEGSVRLSAPPALASQWLVPKLAELAVRHPGLVLDVAGSAVAASLARRESDIAMRLSRPTDKGLVARRLGNVRYGLYGARAYLEAVTEADRAFLGYDQDLESLPQERWVRSVAAGRRFAMLSNDLASLVSGVKAGMGLAALPHILVSGEPDLACVAEGREADRELWLVVHPDLRRSARVRVVMDHLFEITAPLRIEARGGG